MKLIIVFLFCFAESYGDYLVGPQPFEKAREILDAKNAIRKNNGLYLMYKKSAFEKLLQLKDGQGRHLYAAFALSTLLYNLHCTISFVKIAV